MGAYNFDIDLTSAKSVEDKFEFMLNSIHYDTTRCHSKEWDVEAVHPKTGVIKTFEIKNDEMAHKTGNIVVEVESRGKPSGISTTKSDYWAFHFNDRFYIVKTSTLKERMLELAHRKYVIGGDAGSNTKMHIIKIEELRKICEVII